MKYNTGAQTTRSKASFGPGKCGCSLLEMVLGVLCEGGQEELKKKHQKHTKKENSRKIQYRGPNNAFDRVVWDRKMWM